MNASELQAIRPSDLAQHITFEGCDYVLMSPEEYDAQSEEVRRIKSVLSALIHTPAVIQALNPSGKAHVGKCECPFCEGIKIVWSQP